MKDIEMFFNQASNPTSSHLQAWAPCLQFFPQFNFDGLVKSRKVPFSVIPRTQQRDLRQAEAGIQSFQWVLDSGFRRSNELWDFLLGYQG